MFGRLSLASATGESQRRERPCYSRCGGRSADALPAPDWRRGAGRQGNVVVVGTDGQLPSAVQSATLTGNTSNGGAAKLAHAVPGCFFASTHVILLGVIFPGFPGRQQTTDPCRPQIDFFSARSSARLQARFVAPFKSGAELANRLTQAKKIFGSVARLHWQPKVSRRVRRSLSRSAAHGAAALEPGAADAASRTATSNDALGNRPSPWRASIRAS